MHETGGRSSPLAVAVTLGGALWVALFVVATATAALATIWLSWTGGAVERIAAMLTLLLLAYTIWIARAVARWSREVRIPEE